MSAHDAMALRQAEIAIFALRAFVEDLRSPRAEGLPQFRSLEPDDVHRVYEAMNKIPADKRARIAVVQAIDLACRFERERLHGAPSKSQLKSMEEHTRATLIDLDASIASDVARKIKRKDLRLAIVAWAVGAGNKWTTITEAIKSAKSSIANIDGESLRRDFERWR